MQNNIFINLGHTELIYLFSAINSYNPVIDFEENKKLRENIKEALELSLKQYEKKYKEKEIKFESLQLQKEYLEIALNNVINEIKEL